MTIHLVNQKNGHPNAILTHSSSGDPAFDPVLAAAHIVRATASEPNDTPISRVSATLHVTAKDIRDAIRLAALADGLAHQGFPITRLGSHSLRSGGAVHLKILGYDGDMIKKLGRWSSDTYLRYIQPQISNLTSGMAARLAQPLRFFHVPTHATP